MKKILIPIVVVIVIILIAGGMFIFLNNPFQEETKVKRIDFEAMEEEILEIVAFENKLNELEYTDSNYVEELDQVFHI